MENSPIIEALICQFKEIIPVLRRFIVKAHNAAAFACFYAYIFVLRKSKTDGKNQ